MKNILYTIILSFLFSFSVFADFEASVKAYEADNYEWEIDVGNFETFCKEWKMYAEQGNAKAQGVVGAMYYTGTCVTQDFKEAEKWLQLSGERGIPDAYDILGRIYYIGGDGVAQDFKKAAKWFRLAAQGGVFPAQNYLGWMYYSGTGVAQDFKKAAKWYQKAAEQGDAQAQYNLGVMYARGEGVIKNMVISHMWYNIAASNENEDAKKNIAVSNIKPWLEAQAQELARECIKNNYKDCG